MKKLPIGIQSFAKLRTDSCIYVDKTELIHRLLTTGRQYFLSRPRRFGKSMTISTIKEIFEGNKALFEGLWIADNWDWSQTKPVINIPYAQLAYKELGLENVLYDLLKATAEQYDVPLDATIYTAAFNELIGKLAKKHGRVVILIDEYDKPIIDFLETKHLAIAHENRDKLRNFYRCIKDNDTNIEFFLMTGVSRFSQTGIFSHLNHLNDITIDDAYNNLVGITPSELLDNFGEHIDYTLQKIKMTRDELLEEIRLWYNGYSWDGENTVYNPFSLINFFSKRKFQEFWFQSGSPKFLIDLIKEKKLFNFSNLRVAASMVQSYEIEDLDLRTLFFQTGYLTIKEIDSRRGLYLLDYPNREVEQTMANHIIGLMTGRSGTQSSLPIFDIENAFLKNDVETVVKVIKSLLKDVPSYLIDKKDEHFYHALVHLHFRYLGWFLESEVHTSDGRMDAVVKTDTHIYILEFKIDKSAKTALQQITNKDYAAKYALENKQIVGIGINFDTEKKTLDDWAMMVC
ncbi:MAG: hypothetical protein RLZZ292_1868 [Bacteroidota bacterium]|jgi:hypothetical protein